MIRLGAPQESVRVNEDTRPSHSQNVIGHAGETCGCTHRLPWTHAPPIVDATSRPRLRMRYLAAVQAARKGYNGMG
jgi:hypothetical protein